MKYFQIVAVSENRVIGSQGDLPWHFPEDLEYFKTMTRGHLLLMGRKTFESIGSKPLKGRLNVILSRSQKGQSGPELAWISTIAELEPLLETRGLRPELCFIVGGEGVYRETMGITDRIYLTRIPGHYTGDTFFPAWEADFEVQAVRKSEHTPGLEFCILEPKSAAKATRRSPV